MYTVINHIRVVAAHRAEFEAQFEANLEHMDGVPGFLRVHVWRPTGEAKEDALYPHDAYMVQTFWESAEAFQAWVGSPSFRASHREKMPDAWRGGPAMMSRHALAFGRDGG